MDWFAVLELLATISGVLMSANGIPQGLKIFKSRRASDISITSRIMLITGYSVWLLYGLNIGSFPIWIGNICGIAAEVIVIMGYILYR